MFHSVRSRLTFWYAAALLAGLLAFAGWMWFAVSRYLTANADDRINRRVQGLKSAIEAEADESLNSLREELREFAIESPEGELSAVRDRRLRDLLRPTGIDEPILWAAPTGRIGDIYTAGIHYRALRSQVEIGGEPFELAVATSTAEGERFLGQFRLLLIGAAPLLALIAATGGYWMSRRALRPVDELTSAAHRLTLDNLGQRLDVRRTGDELERLGDTWNEMIGRLDGAVTRMRQFTADASHELRTPISVVRTTAELALRRERTAEEYREALDSIRREAEWMTQLAEDLLLLARADSGAVTLQCERVDLNELVGECLRETESLVQTRGIEIETRLSREAVSVMGDRRALHRLLSVLLDNAIQYTPAEGKIGIDTSLSEDAVEINVRNSGDGIREEDLPHIFERFYRGDPARTRQNGAGLGLAIANSIAHAHGAIINASSAAGEHAAFVVRFSRDGSASRVA